MLRFLLDGQKWQLIHDPEFTAGKKLKKRVLEDSLKEIENRFLACLQQAAELYRWPYHGDPDPIELRIMGDAQTQTTSDPNSKTWQCMYPDR